MASAVRDKEIFWTEKQVGEDGFVGELETNVISRIVGLQEIGFIGRLNVMRNRNCERVIISWDGRFRAIFRKAMLPQLTIVVEEGATACIKIEVASSDSGPKTREPEVISETISGHKTREHLRDDLLDVLIVPIGSSSINAPPQQPTIAASSQSIPGGPNTSTEESNSPPPSPLEAAAQQPSSPASPQPPTIISPSSVDTEQPPQANSELRVLSPSQQQRTFQPGSSQPTSPHSSNAVQPRTPTDSNVRIVVPNAPQKKPDPKQNRHPLKVATQRPPHTPKSPHSSAVDTERSTQANSGFRVLSPSQQQRTIQKESSQPTSPHSSNAAQPLPPTDSTLRIVVPSEAQKKTNPKQNRAELKVKTERPPRTPKSPHSSAGPQQRAGNHRQPHSAGTTPLQSSTSRRPKPSVDPQQETLNYGPSQSPVSASAVLQPSIPNNRPPKQNRQPNSAGVKRLWSSTLAKSKPSTLSSLEGRPLPGRSRDPDSASVTRLQSSIPAEPKPSILSSSEEKPLPGRSREPHSAHEIRPRWSVGKSKPTTPIYQREKSQPRTPRTPSSAGITGMTESSRLKQRERREDPKTPKTPKKPVWKV